MEPTPIPRDHSRVIIHFDYDCFYAQVFENENPVLKTQPLAVQQKQIIVTCNYEARRRGLHKLQLITDAKKICPEVIIVLGEDLTRFRNVSKALYGLLQSWIWSGRAERLGFDEVFLDCSDMIDFNVGLLNHHDLLHSFFCLDKNDPTLGFEFDASVVSGYTQPLSCPVRPYDPLTQRLVLASHLASHLRHKLFSERGYTAAVGIATNKLLSKLVGNKHKPSNQTTLVPPYSPTPNGLSNITAFLDPFDISLIPGIGFKTSHRIRTSILGREPIYSETLIWGGTSDNMTVGTVRNHPTTSAEQFETLLSGPGSPRGIGARIWTLLHGSDPSPVQPTKTIPTQISVEDSYMRLRTIGDVEREVSTLTASLIRRMHVDLLDPNAALTGERKWMAYPRSLRLTTRPRPPLRADGTRPRFGTRVSRSLPLPSWALGLREADTVDVLAGRLVREVLMPAFRKGYDEKGGWDLSLLNVAVIGMEEVAGEGRPGRTRGRDIKGMFEGQERVLREYRVVDDDDDDDDNDDENDKDGKRPSALEGHEDVVMQENKDLERSGLNEPEDTNWDSDSSTATHDKTQLHMGTGEACSLCGAPIPAFAVLAHQRFHEMPD